MALAAAAARTHGSEAGDERARPRAAGVLHRPADRPAAGQPATRSPPTATRSGCCCASPPSAPAAPPSELDIADLDAPLIAAFLDHLEADRGNSVAHPQQPPRRDPLAVRLPRPAPPRARRDRSSACWPSRPSGSSATWSPTSPSAEVDALLAACDQTTWTGRRDHAMFALDDPDRAADLRAGRLDLRRHHPRRRRQRAHASARAARNGEHRCVPADRGACSRPGSPSARGAPDRPAVPDHHRHAPQPRRHRTPPRPPPRDRRARAAPRWRAKHVTDAHAAPHRRHAPAARRQRHHRDRALARPRADHHDQRSTCTPT